MKIFSLRFFLTFLIFSGLNASVIAKTITGESANERVNGAEKVFLNDSTNTISFIRLRADVFVSSASAGQWLTQKVLNASSATSFEKKHLLQDGSGFTHESYIQYNDNIPVEYGIYSVHSKDGRIISASGEFYNNIPHFPVPSITAQSAFANAKKYLAIKTTLADPGSNTITGLVILPIERSYKLCYKCDLYAQQPFGRWYVYVDAITGSIVKSISRIESADAHAIAVTRYYGIKQMTTDSVAPIIFKMRESGRGDGIGTYNMNFGTVYSSSTDFNDADNYWNAATLDNAAYDAHWSAEKTYDFYFSKFNRNSFDNNGGEILNYMHYSVAVANAFWDGTRMSYGDGDQVNYDPFTSTEIVAHEITHAVTQYSAGLVYVNESGALNESVSDMLGTAINQYANPSTAGWLIGDKIALAGAPFRNLSDPNMYGQPDTYHGNFWDANMDVHVNSGVGNYWFYLLTSGGSGTNDAGHNYSITGIGIDEATQIIYRALTVYLTPNSSYNDARNYTIEAAFDLFGSCSNQLIQCINAWSAVGLGTDFNPAATITFTATPTQACGTPSDISFHSTSVNVTSFLWNFGDGTFDTISDPVHSYSTSGNYSVTVIGADSTFCNGIDTFTRQNYLSIAASPLAPPSCRPSTLSYCCNAGIAGVHFGSINNLSGNASEGYRDFSCIGSDTIAIGDFELLSITLNYASPLQKINCWIDYNNDGIFTDSVELVYQYVDNGIISNQPVYTSPQVVPNIPLRMRFMQTISSSPITSACQDVDTGQVEDYAITFVTNSKPPVADFKADDIYVDPGDSIHFSDFSRHFPTSWQWSFPGGLPSTSADTNPVIQYLIPGQYTVTLNATNAFGTTTMTKLAFVHVSSNFYSCGSLAETHAPNGNFIMNSYGLPDTCTFLITPPCASSLIFSFNNSFNIYPGDTLFFYNGASESDPLLASITSNSGNLQQLQSTVGDVLIKFKKSVPNNYYSHQFAWNTLTANSWTPVANFSYSPASPALLTPVQFTNLSSVPACDWYWDFGNGQSSNDKNPAHSFSLPGINTVTMIAYSCGSSDTVVQSINIQNAPQLVLDSTEVHVVLNCSDSASALVKLKNISGGDLIYHVSRLPSTPVRILVFSTDTLTSANMLSSVSAIRQNYPNIIAASVFTYDPSQLETALSDKDVFLIHSLDRNQLNAFSALSSTLFRFTERGGVVIICPESYSYYPPYSPIVSGFFTGGSYLNSGPCVVADSTHPIMEGVPNNFTSNGTEAMNFTNPGNQQLVISGGNDVVTLRQIGLGYAIYIGFNYYQFDNNLWKIIGNTVKWIAEKVKPQWVSCFMESGIISAGDSSSVEIKFSALQTPAGIYHDTLKLQTNDPLQVQVNIPVTLTIHGFPDIFPEDSCFSLSAMQYSSSTRTFSIKNNGCDSLFVFNVYHSSPEISLGAFTDTIPAFQSGTISVTYHPSFAGQLLDTLVIRNNDHDTSICISGTSLPPPAESAGPDTISVSLTQCHDTAIVPFTVYNNGISDLSFTLQSSGLGDTINAMIITYGVIDPDIIPNIESSITCPVKIHLFDISNYFYLADHLKNIDVVIIPKQEIQDTLIYHTFAGPLQDFVNKGGTVILCAPAGNCIANLSVTGLIDIDISTTINGQPLQVTDSSTLLTQGLPRYFRSSVDQSFLIHNPAAVRVISYFQDDMVSYRNSGDGKIIFIGYDFTSIDSNFQTILTNAIEWVHASVFPSWLRSIPLSGTISPGGSSILNLYFTNDLRAGGIHTSTVYISSNDPLHPVDSIVCILHSRDLPCSSFSWQDSVCTGDVQFNDESNNYPSHFYWDFGDGTNDTTEDPLHHYAVPGNYSVMLVVCNQYGCDTITHEVVSISFAGQPAVSCTPSTYSYCCQFGIYRVVLNQINATSASAQEGYQDRTCLYTARLSIFGTYTLYVWTGPNYPEDVFAWIDYNSDGSFDSTEMIMMDTTVLQYHSGSFTVPGSAVCNRPLYLRVGSEYSNHTFLTGCSHPFRGQYEDYSVILDSSIIDLSPALAPIAGALIYPNPFSNTSTLEFNLLKNETVTVELFDMTGHLVKILANGKKILAGKVSLPINKLEPGVYFTRIVAGDFRTVLKIISIN